MHKKHTELNQKIFSEKILKNINRIQDEKFFINELKLTI